MNINLDDHHALAASIREHQEILGRSGKYVLLGMQDIVLVAEPDPNYPGSMQVWSKTDEGVWVYITPDGVAVESGCPLGD